MDEQNHAAGGIPHEAIAYLAAVRNYYQLGVTRPPRNADIAAAHSPPLNSRTWDRHKDQLRSGKLGGRDWIEVWPPPSDWEPTWVDLIPPEPKPEYDPGLAVQTWQETYQRGKLLERRLIHQIGHLGAVAAVLTYAVLDLNDGRLDGVIRACRVLARALLMSYRVS